MTGWDATLTVRLEEPWQAFTLDLFEDPPMGAFLDLREAAAAALANPGDLATIERAIAAFSPLVASHTIVDREGKPLELSLRSMPSGLFLAIITAIQRQMYGKAAPVPLSGRTNSPGRSSRARGSRRGSSSGSSQSG